MLQLLTETKCLARKNLTYAGEFGMDRLNVALLSPAWLVEGIPNGVASYVKNLVPALDKIGATPFVLTTRADERSTPAFVRRIVLQKEEDLGIVSRVLRKLMRDWWRRRQVGNGIAKELLRLRMNSGVELMEMEESFGWARAVAGQGIVPVVVRLHGPHFLIGPLAGMADNRRFQRRVIQEGQAIECAQAISAPSKDVLSRTRNYYGMDLPLATVIANPMAPCQKEHYWQAAECNRKLVLFVGRFDGVKGGDTMIDAFARITVRRPDARLALVGPDRGLIDSSGKKWGILEYIDDRFGGSPNRRQIEWLGTKGHEEIANLRQNAAVTVVCSRYETFGLTAIEAMAAGCPLVATDVGGLGEIVQHERNGLQCRPDDPGDLAEKILAMLEQRDLAARLGAQAMKDVTSQYHPDVIAKQTIEFYREVISQWNSRAHNS